MDTIEKNIANTTDNETKQVLFSMEGKTNEELLELLKKANVVDDQQRIVTFASKDEAIIYATGIKIAHPDVTFFKISECYSPELALFYIIEPQAVNNESKNVSLSAIDNFCMASTEILAAAIELSKRLNKK